MPCVSRSQTQIWLFSRLNLKLKRREEKSREFVYTFTRGDYSKQTFCIKTGSGSSQRHQSNKTPQTGKILNLLNITDSFRHLNWVLHISKICLEMILFDPFKTWIVFLYCRWLTNIFYPKIKNREKPFQFSKEWLINSLIQPTGFFSVGCHFKSDASISISLYRKNNKLFHEIWWIKKK